MSNRQPVQKPDDAGRIGQSDSNQSQQSPDVPAAGPVYLPPDKPMFRAMRQNAVLNMQQRNGNAAVVRMLQRKVKESDIVAASSATPPSGEGILEKSPGSGVGGFEGSSIPKLTSTPPQIARAPTEPAKPQTEGKAAEDWQPKLPPFTRATPTEPLPGEPVPGVTDKQPPYTKKDLDRLNDALLVRHQENVRNIPLFVAHYTSALTQIWTGYVTDEMIKAAEDSGWSLLAKVAGFVIRESLIALLFPELELESIAEKMAYKLVEKSSAAALEIGQGAIEEKTGGSKLEKRGHALRARSKELGTQLATFILPLMTKLGDDYHYKDWLDEAKSQWERNLPSVDLHLFRLPHKFPEKSEEQIRSIVAQLMAGYVHDEKTKVVYRHDENVIKVDLEAAGPGQVTGGAYFRGAEAFAEEIEGTIADMPRIPLVIELKDLGGLLNLKLIVLGKEDDRAKLKMIADAWPYKSPLNIQRNSDGDLITYGGGLYEMFHIYERANPAVEFMSLVGGLLQAIDISDRSPVVDPTSPMAPPRIPAPSISRPLTPAMAAKGLASIMEPSLQDGVEFFVKDSVMPLKIHKRAAE